MSENNLPNAAVMITGDDELGSSLGLSSLNLSSGSSSETNEISQLVKGASTFAKLPALIDPANKRVVPGAVAYDPDELQPDWGGYTPPNMSANNYGDVFEFAFGSLTLDASSPMFKAISAAAKQGISLFANAEDEDAYRIVINDPGNGGADLQIGKGLHLSVGATLDALLSANGLGSIATQYKQNSNMSKVLTHQGKGHMIIWNKTGVTVDPSSNTNNPATMEVGAGNKLYVGGVNTADHDAYGTGNLKLGFSEKSAFGQAAMTLDDGSYLSVNGYLGGYADKSNAGQSVGNGMQGQRTGAVLTKKDVHMDIDGDWGLIGDTRLPNEIKPVWTQVGDNNHIKVLGNMGVYMRASMTVGSNTDFKIGSQGAKHTGSGLFIGSGGYMSTGFNNSFNIAGGMGAGYIAQSGNQATNLLIGDSNTIILDDKYAAIFASEGGAIVSVGNGVKITGAEISVGYGEDNTNRTISPSLYNSANMLIGDNVNISLGYENLPGNENDPHIARDGVIALDAQNSQLVIGNGATIQAKLLSVGNYLRNSLDSRFLDSNHNPLAEFHAGNNNSVVIGTGANITLGKGLVIDEDNGYINLQGGTLTAGFMSIGRFYQSGLEVPMGGLYYQSYNASAGKIVIGDNYQVNLTTANGQTGNITLDGNGDTLSVGNNAKISGHQLYLGDYRVDGKPDLKTPMLTSNASITIGQATSMTFDSDVRLNGINNIFTMLDNSYLHANTMILDKGVTNTGSNNTLNFGANTTIDINSGITDNIVNGHFTLGQGANLLISNGDFQMGATAANSFTVGNNASLTLQTGNIVLNSSYQSAIISNGGIVTGNQLIMNGSNQIFSAGNNAQITLSGGIQQNATTGIINIGNSAIMNVGAVNITGNTTSFTLGSNVQGKLGNTNLTGTGINFTIVLANNLAFGDINLGNRNSFSLAGSMTGSSLSAGNNTNISVTAATDMNLGSGAFSLGDNDTFNFSTGGNANALTAGNMTLGNNVTFNVSGNIKGGSLSAGNGTRLDIGENSFFNLGSGAFSLGNNDNVLLHYNTTITAGDISFASAASTGNGFEVYGYVNGASLTLGSNTRLLVHGSYGSHGAGINLGNGALTLDHAASINLETSSYLTAGKVSLDLGFTNANFATSQHLHTNDWEIGNTSGAAKTISFGDATDGQIGNINLLGSNITFSAGTVKNLAFGDINLGNNNNFSVTGTMTGNSLSAGSGTHLDVQENSFFNFGNGALTFGADDNFLLHYNTTVTAGDISFASATSTGNGFEVYGYINGASLTLGANTRLLVHGGYGSYGAGINLGSGALTLDHTNSISLENSSYLTAGTVSLDLGFTNTNFGSSQHLHTNDWEIGNTGGNLQSMTFGNGADGQIGSLNLLGNNITFNTGIVSNLAFGDINLGNNNSFNLAGTMTGSSLSAGTGTIVSAAANTSIDLGSGNVTFDGNNNFTLATGATFKSGIVKADLNSVNFNLASSTHYKVGGFDLDNTGATQKVFTIGNNADGSLGNMNFLGNNIIFNTGTGNNLAFGIVNVNHNTQFNIANGTTATMDQLALSDTGKVIVNNSTLNVNSLSMDGTNPVTIEVSAGSTLNIGSVSTLNVGTNRPQIIVHGNAHVTVNGLPIVRDSSTSDYTVHFDNAGNGIYEYKGNIQDLDGHLAVENFSLSDELLFNIDSNHSVDSGLYRTSYDANSHLLSVIYQGANGPETLATFTYSPANSADPLPNVVLTSGTDGTNHIAITKCFVAGTHILTSKGEMTVEVLQVGDEVVTIENGQRHNRKIVWIGNMDVDVNKHQEKDTLYPIRIKAHAFGLNKPYRDLLITPEHTVFVDGGLIPARMLVNGRSIIVDKTMKNFTVYHIETEQHSILLSENLMTESYLNTDDRYLFDKDVAPLHLTFDENAGHKSWEDAAAPLMVERNRVEPIWQRLDRRATQLGYKPVAKQTVTRDPDLCLITQRGERLAPVNIKGNIYSFYVPAVTQVVAMSSRAALPSEVIGPFVDDRRKLGVLVAKISVVADKTLTVLPSDISNLSGWHPIESNRTDRWTKGLAQLPSEITDFSNKDKLIKIELVDVASYLIDNSMNEIVKLA